MQNKLCCYLVSGMMAGFGVNILLSYQVITMLRSFWFYFYSCVGTIFAAAAIISWWFADSRFQVKVTARQKDKAMFFGFALASVILATFSFGQVLAWFAIGKPITHVYVNGSPLAVYPPDLIFDLIKSTFLATFAGFFERYM